MANISRKNSSGLTVTNRPTADLRPNPQNPRVHTTKQIKQIAKAIKSLGFNVPILVDEDDTVIAGHGRLLAAKELGLKEIPTIRIEHLNDAQKRAFLIADNKLTENSTFDQNLLAFHFKELSEADLNFDLDVTGFEVGEIDFLVEGEAGAKDKNKDDPDTISFDATAKKVTRRGDLWILGSHRVLCGSALDDAAYATLMAGKLAHIVFTDPPYNVPIEGHVSKRGKHREFAMASGEMSQKDFGTFLSTSLEHAAKYSAKGAIHFIFMDWRHAPDLLAAGTSIYSELKNICVWVKDTPGMGSLYRSQHELVFAFKNGKGPHKNNVKLGVHGRNRSNVWSYPGVAAFGRGSDEGRLADLHPTVKPTALVGDALLDCSSRGDLVLDPFLGSGSTLIAAQRTGRKCCGMEIDPIYVDTIVRRYQKFTGVHALHAVTGRTFNELEKKAAKNGKE